MPRPFGFRFFNQDNHPRAQFWEDILGSGAGDLLVGSRFFQVVSRFFGLSSTPGDAQVQPPAPGIDANVRIVRPQFDTAATAAATIVPDDIRLGYDFGAPATVPASGPVMPEPILSGVDNDRQAVTFFFESAAQSATRIADGGPIGSRFGKPQYAAVISDLSDTGYVYDTGNMQLLPGGPGDYPELFGDSGVGMILSGDYSAGVSIEPGIRTVESIELLAGNSYNLIAPDGLVRAGEVLNVSAATLGAGDHFMFDGSAESDGMFFILGSGGADVIIGGAGDDRFYGRGGGDALAGGGGSDAFIYFGAGESSGADYDTIGDFDPAMDRIDLPGAVSGFADAIEGGTLSTATFNEDLAAALGGLGSSQAVWFAPDTGDLAGQVFLIVDGNGQAGYQEGEDFVIAVQGAPLTDLTGHTDIFI